MRLIVPVCLLVTAVVTGAPLDLNRGVIVHMFEWQWKDIAKECEEFLSPHGYGGIQISPPNENLIVPARNWWERYQPVSYKMQTRSGNEKQLKNMIHRCNKVGIRVFADLVINHMTGDSDSCVGTAGSTCDPSTLSFPGVPYSYEHFHTPECDLNNYNNATEVRVCKLVGLHDLNQSVEYVRGKTIQYLNSLIDIGVAGFRVDAAKHVWPANLEIIYGSLKNLNIKYFPENTQALIYQEVTDLTGLEAVHYQEYTPLGLVTDFRVGVRLGRSFQGLNYLKVLQDFGSSVWDLLPANESISFIENHDTERGGGDVLNYKNPQQYKMAIAFMLAWGYSQSKILSSFYFEDHDQGPPHDSNFDLLSPFPITDNVCSNGFVCQHRWRQIYNMVKFHNVVQGTEVTNWWDNGKNQIAFCKGDQGFIAFNMENYDLNQSLQTCLPEGVYCDIISGSLEGGQCTGKSVSVGSDGYAQIQIDAFNPHSQVDGVLAIHAQSLTETGGRPKAPGA